MSGLDARLPHDSARSESAEPVRAVTPGHADHRRARGLECGLVILPPEHVATAVRSIQAGFPPSWAPPYPPHLTIKSQFACLSSLRRIEAEVSRVCAGIGSFDVNVGAIGCFCDPGAGIFYLSVAAGEALLRLHRALLHVLTPLTTLSASVAPGREGDAYHPHITVLRGVPDAEVAPTQARLAGIPPAGAFRVDSVALICHRPDGPWQPAVTFPLGGGPARRGRGQAA